MNAFLVRLFIDAVSGLSLEKSNVPVPVCRNSKIIEINLPAFSILKEIKQSQSLKYKKSRKNNLHYLNSIVAETRE